MIYSLMQVYGSSPRVWGQVGMFESNYVDNEDHPHACGDKQTKGSSPRVWGQVRSIYLRSVRERIIPTRVGTSRLQKPHLRQGMDHPHACGDKTICTAYPSKSRGSSPRVWGQDTSACDRGFFAGIIPTRVGTSDPANLLTWHIQDHPHACGDKYCTPQNYRGFLGSSPRVWGQVFEI